LGSGVGLAARLHAPDCHQVRTGRHETPTGLLAELNRVGFNIRTKRKVIPKRMAELAERILTE
jgi:hypothetical protein